MDLHAINALSVMVFMRRSHRSFLEAFQFFIFSFLMPHLSQQHPVPQLRTSYWTILFLNWERWESRLYTCSNLCRSRDLSRFWIKHHCGYRCVHPFSDCSSNQSSTKIVKLPLGLGNLLCFPSLSFDIFRKLIKWRPLCIFLT